MKKVLFVCMGNICRSPAAEGILNNFINQNGLRGRIQVDSAGTIDYHEGELPDPRMIEVASARGYSLNHRARQITKKDLDNFDYIITMDDHVYNTVLRTDSSKKHNHKIFKMTDFLTELKSDEIPDPYYGTKKDFEHVIDLLEDASKGLLKFIEKDL